MKSESQPTHGYWRRADRSIAPQNSIVIVELRDATTKRARATWNGWLNVETGKPFDSPPVQWRFLVEEVDL